MVEAARVASAAAPAAAATARPSASRPAADVAGMAMLDSLGAPYMAIHLWSIQSFRAHNQSAWPIATHPGQPDRCPMGARVALITREPELGHS